MEQGRRPWEKSEWISFKFHEGVSPLMQEDFSALNPNGGEF